MAALTVQITWLFLNAAYELKVLGTKIPNDLFTSPLQDCQALFAEALLEFHRAKADHRSITFYRLTKPMNIWTPNWKAALSDWEANAELIPLPVTLSSIFRDQPDETNLNLIVTATLDPGAQIRDQVRTPRKLDNDLTSRWIALKNSSFFNSDGTTSPEPKPGSVLRHDNSAMMFSAPATEVSFVFVRECYLKWWNKFVAEFKQKEKTYPLSSSPGCGKTIGTSFIFKMITLTNDFDNKPILYQFIDNYYYIHMDQVFVISPEEAREMVRNQETFYVLDGVSAQPVTSECPTLFIASPRNKYFKGWWIKRKTTPLYFPVWSWSELQQCRGLCYQELSEGIVEDRYYQYGGIARYVYWSKRNPPDLIGAVADADTYKSIQSIGEPSEIFPNSHKLLHLSVDDDLEFTHVVLASSYVGTLLFAKYHHEMLDKLKSMLGSGSALAGHLFECYAHYLFEYGPGEELTCRPLTGGNPIELKLYPRARIVFDEVPESLSSDKYYVPSRTNFAAADALIKEVALQYTVAKRHPINGVRIIKELVTLYGGELSLVFVVPKSIAPVFKEQSIDGIVSATIHQYVVGLPLSIDTSLVAGEPPSKKARTT